MKKTLTSLIALFLGILFSGCASGSLNYTPPSSFEPNEIKNTKVINKTYEDSWKELINNLTENSFVINNMSKDSGFINISFSTNNPSQYIDCGEWNGHFKNMRGEANYNFKGEESTQFTSMHGTSMVNVISTKSLSGRINVLLQKVSEKQQKMKVNVKYVLTGTNKNMYVYPPRTNIVNWNVDFSTKNDGRAQGGQTQCQTTGYLEEQLLNYIK